MKKFIVKNKFYLTVAVLALAFLVWFLIMLSAGSGRVSAVPDTAGAQKIVDETLSALPLKNSVGAKYIFDNTTLKVKGVEAGHDKDIFITCDYSTLDVLGSLEGRIDDIMGKAYDYSEKEKSSGKMINATKISLNFSSSVKEELEGAKVLTGELELTAYETEEGNLTVYLSDEVVNTISGGLLDVISAIRSTTEVTSSDGSVVDIKNNNTLRTGVSDCISLSNYSSSKPETGNIAQKWWASFKDEFYRNFIKDAKWHYITEGLLVTLSITGLSVLIGILIGFLVAIVRCTHDSTGKLDVLDKICRLYLTVIRGTPVMVQLLIIFFVILLPLGVKEFPAAVLCFGLNSGAYVAEIVRGGIMSIDKGQTEAGRSLGFGYAQTMIYFIIPQAFKAVLPALANEFITLLKESSVAFTIGVADLTKGGDKIRSITYSNFMPLVAVALIYLALVMILTRLVGILERRLRKSEH